VHLTAVGGDTSTKGGKKGKLGKVGLPVVPTASAAAITAANPVSWSDGAEPESLRTIVGVGIDMDTGTMWWRVASEDTLQPFGPVPTRDGVFPAVGLSLSSSSGDEPAKLCVNLGRRPFVFPVPDGYFPVEDVR
jgi:hypothetical protein